MTDLESYISEYKLITVDELDNNYVFVKDKKEIMNHVLFLMRLYLRYSIVFPNGWNNKVIYYNDFVSEVRNYIARHPDFEEHFKLLKFINSMEYYIIDIMSYLTKNIKHLEYNYEFNAVRQKLFCCIDKPIKWKSVCPICCESNRKIQRFMSENQYYLKFFPCDHIICENPCYIQILKTRKIKYNVKDYKLASIDFRNEYPIECVVCRSKLRKAIYKPSTVCEYYFDYILKSYSSRIEYF
jgi:hypothetical protein